LESGGDDGSGHGYGHGYGLHSHVFGLYLTAGVPAMTVRFSHIRVAYTIAECDPPEWLLSSLEYFSRGVEVDENGRVILPNISREVCAAVIVEAWRRFHGSVEPSRKLYAACRMYWGVCGGLDEPDWRRPVEQAIAGSWVRDVIEWYRRNTPGRLLNDTAGSRDTVSRRTDRLG
jgi:hypothetical protein